MTDIVNDPFLNPQKERLVEADGQNMYTPKAGFWEQVGAGWGEGQNWTSLSLLSDLGLKLDSVNPADTIPEEQWNEKHPYYFDDVAWEPDLTLDIARNIYEERIDTINYEKLVERGGGGGMFARGLGIFAGAAWDPINLIAAPAGIYSKATILGYNLLGKAAVAGATNFAIESALQTVAYGTQDVRGQKLGVGDAAMNLGLAFGIGAAFPFIGAAGGAGLRRLGLISKKNKMDGVDFDGADYTPTQKSKIKLNTNSSKNINVSMIDNTNFNTIETIKLNTKGIVDTEGSVTVTKVDDTTVTVTGSAEDLTKVLPTLATKLDNYQNIDLVVDGKTVRTNSNIIDQNVKDFEAQTGVEAKLDDLDFETARTKVEGKDYEIEVTADGELTGRVFRARKDGKRGKQLSKEEADAIINAHKVEVVNNRNKVNENIEPDSQAPNNKTDRSGRQVTEEKLKNKKNYATQNDVDASVGGRSSEYVNNHSNSQTATRSVTAEQVVSQKTLFRAGFFLDENNNLIDLTTTKIKDLTGAQREKIARALGINPATGKTFRISEIPVDENGFAVVTRRGEKTRKMFDDFESDNVARQQHKNNLLDYINCRKGTGTL